MKNKKDILEAYGKRSIDPNYYSKITINVNSEPKELTLKEFRNKEPGIVYMDNETNKLIFKK